MVELSFRLGGVGGVKAWLDYVRVRPGPGLGWVTLDLGRN